MNNTALIIMAHGSRKTEANEEFAQLVRKVALTATDYAVVTHCFLEIASPTLEDSVKECLPLGCQQFDVYPLFFNQGNHVSRDIPKQIQQAQQQHPECHIRQLHYFGMFNEMANSIHQHIQSQLEH